MTPYWSTPIFSLAAPTAGCSNIGCPGDPSAGRTTTGVSLFQADLLGLSSPSCKRLTLGSHKLALRVDLCLRVKGALETWTSACLFFVERVRGVKSRRVKLGARIITVLST